MSFRVLYDLYLGRLALFLSVILFLVACGKADISDIEHVNRAKQYESTGDLKASFIELKNALQQNPKNSEARLMLGKYYLDIGNGAASEKELGHAQKLGVDNTFIQKLMIRALLLQLHYEEALSSINKLDNKDDPELLVLKGEALSGLEKFDESEKTFLKAIDLDSKLLGAYIGLSKIALSQRNFPKANTYSQQALAISSQSPEALLMHARIDFSQSEYSNAEKSYRAVLETQPKGLLTRLAYQARVGSAYTLLAENKPNQALAHVEVLLKANSKHIVPNYLRALIAFKQQDYTTALEYLQPFGSSVSQGDPAQLLLGAVNYILGSYEQADIYLGQYIAAVPTNLYARKLYGATRLKLNQPEEALDVLSTVVSQTEDDASLLAMLGSAAAMKGDFLEGRAYLRKALSSGGDKTQLRAQIAETYLEEGDIDRAIKELEMSLTEGDNTVRPKVMLVVANIKKNDLGAALRLANELLHDWPESPTVLNLVGSVHLLRNENSAATEMFQKALAIAPKYIPAKMNLARIASQSKNINEAKHQYEEILKTDAEHTGSLVALARIAEQQGDQTQSIQLLEKARKGDANAILPRLLLASYYQRAGEPDKAEAVATEAVRAQPTNVRALYSLANVQLVNHKSTDAISSFQKLQSIIPNSPHVFLGLGKSYAQLKRLTDAREAARNAYKADANLVPAVVLLARLEMQMGNTNEAMRLANELQKNQPEFPTAYALQADLYMAQKNYQKAFTAYKAASERRATGMLAISQYNALKMMQLNGDAVKPLVDWLAADPDDQRVRLVLASAYQEIGRNKQAIQEYQHLLKRNPENPHLLNNLAWLYGLENKPEALNYAENAYNFSPNDSGIADTFGWLLVQQGKPRQGVKILEKALNAGSNQPEIRYHLAVALTNIDEKAAARDLLKQILVENKAFFERLEAEKLYESLK